MDKREYEVLDILLKYNQITITQISKQMKLSNKTISKSLDKIEDFLKESELSLIRKPKIGISILGDKKKGYQLLNLRITDDVPNTREERVQYLCFNILANEGYFTLAELSESLFVSKTTLEKDIVQVYEIFAHFHVAIEKIPGKGSFLNIMEYERRKLALDLIYYFWGQNWQIINQDGQFLHLIEGVPLFAQSFVNIEYLKQINILLQQFITKNQLKMSDLNYQSLLLHLLIAVERIKSNQLIDKKYADNKVQHPMIIDLVSVLESSFDIDIPEIEIAYIQIYFNRLSQTDVSEPLISEKRISETIVASTSLDDGEAQHALARHIKQSLERIMNKLPVNNPYTQDIKKNFPLSFDEALSLKNQLEKQFHLFIPEDEVAYMAVHLQTYREQMKLPIELKKSVLLVCSSGKGTSQLLAARIKRAFPELIINRILSVQELYQTKISEDMILSTVNISMPDQNLLIVSPILSQNDRQQIQQHLDNEQPNLKRNFEFSRLINEELIFLDKSFFSIGEILTFIGKQLVERGYAFKEIIASAVEREEFSYTSFGKFATPHGNAKFVKKSAIIFLRLKNELTWGNTNIRFVFFLCVKDEKPQQLEKIFDSLLEIIDENEKGYLLKGNKQQILDYLKEGS
ncbi:MAG: BglG family transcription antiterminator [Enterococcus viikkiensis]|uniref:BglG family transcription antiterminator n=1 Tax=Enterococcus viikkiensis TaxID=930854 RepID=A0ABU3FM89_9ENTE|nr:BglG family transcription antiterminator [Enterococcus viikkiensis]MDT2827090.1 BglG family transcription antiterminator [Enterococcus viikkiensis]